MGSPILSVGQPDSLAGHENRFVTKDEVGPKFICVRVLFLVSLRVLPISLFWLSMEKLFACLWRSRYCIFNFAN